MAKTRTAKETSMPVIVWAVFMTILAIGLGVFVYVLYSDQEKMTADMDKAKKDLAAARTGQAEAEQVALVTRVWAGLADGDDLEKVTLVKEGDKGFTELKRLNALAAERAPKMGEKTAEKVNDAFTSFYKQFAQNPPAKLDLAAVLAEPVTFWPAETDDKKTLKPPSGSSLLQLTVKDRIFRDLALSLATQDRTGYDAAVGRLDTEAKAAGKERAFFAQKAKDLPTDFNNKIAAIEKKADGWRDSYQKDIADTRKEIQTLKDQIEAMGNEKRLLEGQIKGLKDEQASLLARAKPSDPFQYDEPQGKVTARPSDDLVEINLGSDAHVTPGLTFTVLPIDYPQKGRQSRMKVLRLPDATGVYRETPVFVPKATLEVVEVLGPDLSRARITDEVEKVRDKVLPGDLLYNSVWRKGQADHVALVGIFDVNGDGTDDIETVVRDLTKMGIPVDAYFDLKTRKWVGRLTERTRYVVDGVTPIPTGAAGNLDAMTKLNGAIKDAKDEARRKGSTIVHYRDFFGRTGYKVKLDVPEDRINQAAAKYLSGVEMVEPPPGGNN